MKKQLRLFLIFALLAAAVCFTGCAKNGDDVPANIEVTGVSVQSTLSLYIDESERLTVTILPENATNKTVNWSSNKPDVAMVNAETGEVTAVAIGTATVTVTTQDGNKTASCTVTVTPVLVTSVTVQSTFSLGFGETTTLIATILPENATNKTVNWSSNKPDVAMVNAETGEVTAVAWGTATITVTTKDGGKTAYCNIMVDAMYVGYFGGQLVEGPDGKWKFTRRLYVQNADESTSIQWATADGTTGITNTADGKGNTWALKATIYSATNKCFTKNTNSGSISGVDDPNYIWYLPAQNQLMAVWAVHNSFAPANKFSATLYWSATEIFANNAWYVYFGDGNTFYYSKPNSNRVRCVRES